MSATAMQLAPLTRQLDRAFIGLSAAVGEKHMIHAAQLSQTIGQRVLLRHLI